MATQMQSRAVATDSLEASLRGRLLRMGDEEYDRARQVWNGMIDRRPAVIVQCMGTADIMQAVRFARDNDLPVAVRGCGHNIAGKAVCDEGLVIDLSMMKGVRVDPVARTARVEPGAALRDLDHETQAFGLATPLGINSTTGVAGLTLGGGFGWLSRKYGMTIDNLRAVDVVTAEGRLVRASEAENPDLFWATRGGGGNFGIVSSFEFQLHPVGPEVMCGPIVYAQEDGPGVLRHVRDVNAEAPDELAVWAVLRKAPPMPFLPEDVHGTDVVIVVPFYAGSLEAGERAIEPLRAYGNPIADAAGPHPYAAFQQAFDPLLTEGARNYWKSHNFATLTDAAIDTALDCAATLPSAQSEIFFGQVGGAMNRVPVEATAYPHRDAEYVMNVHTRWEDPASDTLCIAWARDVYQRMAPYATGGTYVNFISEDRGEEQQAYGQNYDRLATLKARYDPTNLFHINQNIAPMEQPAG